MHTNGMENKSQKKETQNGEAWHFFPINHRHNDLTAIFQIGSANKRMLEGKKKNCENEERKRNAFLVLYQ